MTLKFTKILGNVAGKSFKDFNDEEKKLTLDGILLNKVLDDANRAFESGAASSETLAKKLLV